MRLLFLHAVLLLGLVPGLPGALEDAAHLLAEGHTLHDAQHDAAPELEHQEHEGESGCDDCGHEGLCHCHGQTSIAPARAVVGVAAPLAADPLPAAESATRPTSRRVDALERPPRA